ncbi:MAG TPA: transporter [Stenotrophomonas sp.]|nr:transporter [Stenotrophomonas sp.]
MPTRNTRCLTIWSGKSLRRALLVLAVLPALAAAQDEVSFDRPGVAFGTEVLNPGQWAWEQGLPDYSSDDEGGARTRQYTLDSRLRVGLGADLELQVAADSFNWQRGSARAQGGGDSAIALKWQLPSAREDFSWALLGTYTAATGQAPFTAGGPKRDLGLSLSWQLPRQSATGLYLDYGSGGNGRYWTVSPNWTLHDDGRWMAYVEAAWSGGAEHERQLGGGMAWHLRPNVQLDASVLRGLDSASTDWQAGVGLSFALR